MAKQIVGTVVSTKMQKTITLSVEQKYRHPLYRKVLKKHSNIKAHNELEGITEGDTVMIVETRPLSKEVSFTVLKKIKSINN